MQMKAEYINHMGDDLMVVNAARVSFDKQSEWEIVAAFYGAEEADHQVGPRQQVELVGECPELVTYRLSDRDIRLIRYLAREGHWTPFAHPQITLRMTAPVFVRTQCFKHKVGFTENEVSRRYVDSEPEFYSPTGWRGRSASAKQGSAGVLDRDHQLMISADYHHAVNACLEVYEWMLNTGVCPEQARMVLPQSMMTQWYWTGSLAAYARFCRQRLDSHAQAEVRELAGKVSAIIKPLFPVSWSYLTGEVV